MGCWGVTTGAALTAVTDFAGDVAEFFVAAVTLVAGVVFFTAADFFAATAFFCATGLLGMAILDTKTMILGWHLVTRSISCACAGCRWVSISY
jgi:hypothetical protein